MLIQGGYINNKQIKTDKVISIYSPETDEVVAQIYGMNGDFVEFAIENSKNAFELWKNISFQIRKVIIDRFIINLEQSKVELAQMLVSCIAKSFNDSLSEVERSIEYIKCTLDAYINLFQLPKVIDQPSEFLNNKIGLFGRVPLGVVLAISPFNYPINLSISKIIPALLVGNTVVFKPATQTAPVGIKLVELLIKSGLPPGVVQCLIGGGSELGDALVKNKNIAMITFTGSSVVGQQILQISSVGHIVLELGGLDAALVFDDADLDVTAKEIVKGAFSYSGQRCTAIKRVIVDNNIADLLIDKIVSLVKKITVGKASDNATVTALINKNSLQNALNAIDDAVSHGATILIGGQCRDRVLEPTVLDNVQANMIVYNHELFAPVLPIIRVTNENDMVRINNDTCYGLQASIFTTNYLRVIELSQQLDVGTVNWNRASSRGPDYFPFLGVKNSGVGVQGIVDALLSMTRYKGLTFVNDESGKTLLNNVLKKE